MSAYNLDTEAARQADSGGKITQSSKHIGQFTKAKKVLSEKGTQGIEFSFKSKTGQEAEFLTLWTINKDGKQIYGYKQLMALMTCLKVRSIEARKAKIEEYDHEKGEIVTREVELYADLMNKDVGTLFQMEEYEKRDGSTGEKPSFAGFFNAESEQVALEILEKREPEVLERLVAALTPLKKLRGSRAANPGGGNNSYGSGPAFDDSIPF